MKDVEITEKLCTDCGQVKDISEFCINRAASKDGLNWSCKECHKQYNKQYNKDHVEEINQYHKDRYINNIQARIAHTSRIRLNIAVKSQSTTKSKSTFKLTGCTIGELMLYLESKFVEGMNWDNYSMFGWHIDHILPCSSFDLTDIAQQEECFHYTNLQPLWWYDNLSKGGRPVM